MAAQQTTVRVYINNLAAGKCLVVLYQRRTKFDPKSSVFKVGFRFGVEILLNPQRIDTRVLHVFQYFVTNTIQIDKSSYNFTNLTIFDN